MPKPLRARLLRYALYLSAVLLISLLILLWQAPTLTQRHLPGWLASERYQASGLTPLCGGAMTCCCDMNVIR